MTTAVLVSSEADDQIGRELIKTLPGVSVVEYDPSAESLYGAQLEAKVLVAPYRSSHRPIRFLGALPELQLVQLLSAGIDEWSGAIPDGVVLKSARGAHAGPVSEWILSAALAILRQWPALWQAQQNEVWAHRRFQADTLAGKRVLIIGAGSIGTAAAHLFEALGAMPTLVASERRGSILGASELQSVLPDHQVIVLTLPLTAQTAGLVNEEFLAALDTGATLINAGRGKLVDTAALMRELRSGRLRAALDVTDPEPLPPGHPLWSCPGVIISPHSARTVPGTNRLCYEVAVQRVADFLGGGPVG